MPAFFYSLVHLLEKKYKKIPFIFYWLEQTCRLLDFILFSNFEYQLKIIWAEHNERK